MDEKTNKYLETLLLTNDVVISVEEIEDNYKNLSNIYNNSRHKNSKKINELNKAKNYLIKNIDYINQLILLENNDNGIAKNVDNSITISNHRKKKKLIMILSIIGSVILISVSLILFFVIRNKITTDKINSSITYTFTDDYYTMNIGYNCQEENIIVNSIYNDYPIKQVNFNSNKYIKSISLENCNDSLQSINCNYCTRLETVVLPKRDINVSFQSCSSLKTINLEYVTTIPNNAFENCTSLNNISLNNIKTIYSYAFSNCTKLSDVYLGASLNEIKDYAFKSCNISNFDITPCNNITSIGKSILENTPIDKSIKHGYYKSGSWMILAHGINTNLTINCNVADYCFADCSEYIESITFATSSCNYIGAHSFEGIQVSTISLPSSIKSIGFKAFFGNKSLKELYFYFTDPTVIYGNEPNVWAVFGYDSDNNFWSLNLDTIKVPSSALTAYKNSLYDNENYAIYKLLTYI